MVADGHKGGGAATCSTGADGVAADGDHSALQDKQSLQKAVIADMGVAGMFVDILAALPVEVGFSSRCDTWRLCD